MSRRCDLKSEIHGPELVGPRTNLSGPAFSRDDCLSLKRMVSDIFKDVMMVGIWREFGIFLDYGIFKGFQSSLIV